MSASIKLIWSIELSKCSDYGSPMISGCEFEFIDKDKNIILPCNIIKNGKEYKVFYNFNKSTGECKFSAELLKCKKEPFIFPEFREVKVINTIIRTKQFKNKESNVVECLQDGKTMWEVRHKGYLYTDIVLKNNCAIFGTDGNGGGLYCVDIVSGKILCDFNTGGTTFFDWYHDNLVLFQKNKLIIFNPFTFTVLAESRISSKFPHNTVIKVCGNEIYSVVFTDNNQVVVQKHEIPFDLELEKKSYKKGVEM